MSIPVCRCGRVSELVTGQHVYPRRRDLWNMRFYVCDPCDARVGCHPGTTTPLGNLADAATRKARMFAHDAFDPLWRGRGRRARRAAYAWLRQELGVTPDECHIGKFDVATCNRVVALCDGRQPFSRTT